MLFLINQWQILSSLVDNLDWKYLGVCDPSCPLGALCTVILHSCGGDLGGQGQQIHPSSKFNLEEIERHTLP